jgi:hypothetical protein
MKCQNCGFENDDAASYCAKCGRPLKREWFYVVNGASTGPVDIYEMRRLLETGVLTGETYVWKEGMSDWTKLSQTELAAYIPQPPVYNEGVQPRNVLLYFALTIITCGLFGLYWIYALAKDVNTLAQEKGRPAGCDPILSVVLMFLTCNIYTIYFFWKESTVLSTLPGNRGNTNDDRIIITIIAVFLPVASCMILQSDLNDYLAD